MYSSRSTCNRNESSERNESIRTSVNREPGTFVCMMMHNECCSCGLRMLMATAIRNRDKTSIRVLDANRIEKSIWWQNPTKRLYTSQLYLFEKGILFFSAWLVSNFFSIFFSSSHIALRVSRSRFCFPLCRISMHVWIILAIKWNNIPRQCEMVYISSSSSSSMPSVVISRELFSSRVSGAHFSRAVRFWCYNLYFLSECFSVLFPLRVRFPHAFLFQITYSRIKHKSDEFSSFSLFFLLSLYLFDSLFLSLSHTHFLFISFSLCCSHFHFLVCSQSWH